MMSLGGIGNMDRDYVGFPEKVLEGIGELVGDTRYSFGTNNVVAEHVGLKAHGQHAGHLRPNSSSTPDYTNPLPLKLFSHQLVLYPMACLHLPIREGNLPQKRQHQG